MLQNCNNYSLDSLRCRFYIFTMTTKQFSNAIYLAYLYNRSVKKTSDLDPSATHATLETFAAVADLPFKVTPAILAKAKNFTR